MLTAMLERPEVAAVVLELLSPDEMLFGSHRDVAVQLAEARTEHGAPSLAHVAERLAGNEELFATAVDLAVAEEAYDTEAIEDDVSLIREAKLLRGEGVPMYKAERLYETTSGRVQAQGDEESLAALENQVRQGLEDGSLTPDNPLYQRYIDIRRQLHGAGELSYWDID
jgi:hypothetical protein